MENINSKLTVTEKIRLFNGVGSWNTFAADGKLPVITMSDGPHGLRKQDMEEYADLNKSKVATCFPTASSLASSWNVEAAAKTGRLIGREAKKEQVNLLLGPGINIKRSPLCGRNFEYFSEDPFLAGTMAASYINAMQKEGVGTSVKHFAANNQEKRRQTSNSIIDERTLHEIYLRAFEIAVKKGAPVSIMASYNRVNGKYVAHHKELLTDILREKWGFKGFVVSDWGACIESAACVKAGMDLAMPDSKLYLDKNLQQAIADKVIEESDLDKANEHLLYWVKNLTENFETCDVDYDEHHKAALENAEESAVLLKNDGFFPLTPEKSKKIFVAGELAEFMKFQGGGSSHITTREFPNALESLKNCGFEPVYSKSYYSGFCSVKKTASLNKPLFAELKCELEKAISENPEIPVLFFCGLTEKYEGEGFDRIDLNLPAEQLEVLNYILGVTKNVGVITFSGSPVAMPFKDDVKAILHMYLCGEACGEAVAALVSGKVCPSGKLAETFPLKVEDTPCYENFAGDSDNVEYREGVLVGYRHYDSKKLPVLFDFGFGLSYTRFEYSDFKVLTATTEEGTLCGVKVQLCVENVGDYDGGEIVQIYVKNPVSDKKGKLRAVRELRGFTKVFLKKGEKKQVEIVLDDNAFKVFSNKLHEFVTVSGEYEIQACASLNDVRCSEKFSVSDGAVFEEVVDVVAEEFYENARIIPHTKGNFTISDSLIDMSKSSWYIRLVLKILTIAICFMNKGKSKDDPSLKIAISALYENPLESLISTSGGAVDEEFARSLLRRANK